MNFNPNSGTQLEVIANRIAVVEDSFGLVCSYFGSVNRNTAKCRDKGVINIIMNKIVILFFKYIEEKIEKKISYRIRYTIQKLNLIKNIEISKIN